MILNFDDLLSQVKKREPRKIAIAAAADEEILQIVQDARASGIATFFLIDEKTKLLSLAGKMKIAVGDDEIIDVKNKKEMVCRAISMVQDGLADFIMKGQMQTAEFLRPVLDKESGIRTDSLLSEITVYEKISGDGFQFATDCALNVAPDLNGKKQLIENGVALAGKLGCGKPKVAVLAAVEVVNPGMPETLDAAILSKMGDRGQIKNAVIDGPLALDNAISIEAARHKNIDSQVAGQADILIMPDIKAGNIFHKSLVYVAGRRVASVVMGAKIPIIMTSRSDTQEGKRLSIALASFLIQA